LCNYWVTSVMPVDPKRHFSELSIPPEKLKKMSPRLPAVTAAYEPFPVSISMIGSPPVFYMPSLVEDLQSMTCMLWSLCSSVMKMYYPSLENLAHFAALFPLPKEILALISFVAISQTRTNGLGPRYPVTASFLAGSISMDSMSSLCPSTSPTNPAPKNDYLLVVMF